jgi:hypothetical protein
MHLGTPTSRQRECYTRVLMGNIGLHTTVFPADTPGFMLDSFARRALWQAGLDYRHGTGHGVGAALNVHEGPQGVSPRYGNTTPLQSGMVVSNEPGYVRGWKHLPPLALFADRRTLRQTARSARKSPRDPHLSSTVTNEKSCWHQVRLTRRVSVTRRRAPATERRRAPATERQPRVSSA